MKQFFKFMFASMLGTFLSIGIAVIFFFIFISVVITSVSKNKEIILSNKSILVLKLDQPISERSTENPFENFDYTSFSADPGLGLNDILSCIKKAKTDSRISGIYLELSSIYAGIASIEEIRNALADFKTSGKFIVAYSESFSQTAYYLASIANDIYLYPEGSMDFRGLSAEVIFYKQALEKLEVEPQIIRHGKFKSAVEPFIMDKMSDENRAQLSSFTNSVWNYIVNNISVSRGVEPLKLKQYADSFLIQTAEDAVKYGFVDQLAYKDQVWERIRKLNKLDKDKKISFVGLNNYSNVIVRNEGGLVSEKIAIIYAFGDIESGKGDDETIGSDRVAAAILKARQDKNIKAIVLRINSPGGSALASDVIWREVCLAKKSKPVIASLGDYAASGGYYIACAANKIIAQPVTVTGSIGVFGLSYNFKGLLNNKLGITVDTVKTGRYSDFGNPTRPLTLSEKVILQKSVEKIYEEFITRVAEGRNIRKTFVDSIGEGRVWSAIDGKNLGLIDEFGGVEVAVKRAAELAGIKKFRTIELPDQKEAFEQLLEKISGDAEEVFFKEHTGKGYTYFKELYKISKMNGIQARMPFSLQVY